MTNYKWEKGLKNNFYLQLFTFTVFVKANSADKPDIYLVEVNVHDDFRLFAILENSI